MPDISWGASESHHGLPQHSVGQPQLSCRNETEPINLSTWSPTLLPPSPLGSSFWLRCVILACLPATGFGTTIHPCKSHNPTNRRHHWLHESVDWLVRRYTVSGCTTRSGSWSSASLLSSCGPFSPWLCLFLIMLFIWIWSDSLRGADFSLTIWYSFNEGFFKSRKQIKIVSPTAGRTEQIWDKNRKSLNTAVTSAKLTSTVMYCFL